MPVEIITNSVSAIGSLALLLHPAPEPPLFEVRSNAAPAAPAEALLGDWGGVRTRFQNRVLISPYNTSVRWRGMSPAACGRARSITDW